MKKTIFVAFAVIFTLLFASIAEAGMIIPSSDQAKEHAQAPEKSPVISQTDSGEWELDRVDFIHRARPFGPVNKVKDRRDICYKSLGYIWKTLPVNYVINPNNQDGLSADFVAQTIANSAETWDAETGSELFNNNYQINTSAVYGVQDFNNAIVFGSYPDDNVIAITSIWFTRKGRQIVEFDMLFNEKYTWGDAGINPAVMDLANIAVHELGHAAGLDDIYTSTCTEVSMYGYSAYGETKKRTLETSDIKGIESLYGV